MPIGWCDRIPQDQGSRHPRAAQVGTAPFHILISACQAYATARYRLPVYAVPAMVYEKEYYGLRLCSANGTSHGLEERVACHHIDVPGD